MKECGAVDARDALMDFSGFGNDLPRRLARKSSGRRDVDAPDRRPIDSDGRCAGAEEGENDDDDFREAAVGGDGACAPVPPSVRSRPLDRPQGHQAQGRIGVFLFRRQFEGFHRP